MIFVYTQGLRGPSPEKWPQMLYDTNNNPKPFLTKHELPPEQEHLSLTTLSQLYPPPPQEQK